MCAGASAQPTLLPMKCNGWFHSVSSVGRFHRQRPIFKAAAILVLTAVTFNHGGDFRLHFPQDIVHPFHQCSALFPDVVMCSFILHFEFQEVLC